PGAYKKIPCPIAGMKWNVRTVLLSRSARGIPSELSRIVTRTDFRLAREIGLSRPAASVLFNGTHTFTTGEPPVPAWIRSALPLALLTAAFPALIRLRPPRALPARRGPRRPGQRHVVVVQADRQTRGPGDRSPLGPQPHRRIRSREAPRPGALPGAGSRPADADPPPHLRPDRAAADPGGDRRLPQRHIAGRLREAGRSAARLPALRRAMGPPLDGRRPLRR